MQERVLEDEQIRVVEVLKRREFRVYYPLGILLKIFAGLVNCDEIAKLDYYFFTSAYSRRHGSAQIVGFNYFICERFVLNDYIALYF